MAQFGPVAPPRIVKQLSPRAMGRYHLLLAHDVAANQDEYAKLYNFPNSNIIMDNSVVELKNAVDLDMILTACKAVKSVTIALPDVMSDGVATAERSIAAYETWLPAFEQLYGVDNNDWGFMYIPQGRTIEEWATSAQRMSHYRRINYWGIPRLLTINSREGTRRFGIEIAHALNFNRKIHLLGFSENLVDDVVCARDPRVIGIDSAVPLRAATYGKEMTFDLTLPARGDWWDTAEYVPTMEDNVSTYKDWIRP
jgi:hypothetical protein